MQSKRTIPVSGLADYAANPADYCARRGRPHSSKAAEFGERAHGRETANTSRRPIVWLVSFALLAYCLYLVLPFWKS